MSIYSKPDLKINLGYNTPSYSHKKVNSLNFSCNTGRFLQENSKKYCYKNKLEGKDNKNLNTEIAFNSHNIPKSNINKVLTSSNLNNRKIEIELNKNYSPKNKSNKSMEENFILFKHKQSTSQSNINNKIVNLNSNNNLKEINRNKSKNSLNNINININISKKIISTFYNKYNDKKNLIVKKKSINSLTNSNTKEQKFNKHCKINKSKNEFKKLNNIENILKNQSELILTKKQSNDSCLLNYHSNLIKNKENLNSLAYFSTNSNLSTNTNNKNSNYNNSNVGNNVNYTCSDIYSNCYTKRERENNRKNYGNTFNKIIKENKSSFFSQIQIPIRAPNTPGNINSIQNYLKYLNLGQRNKNKNYKNCSPINKNNSHKLSENNLNLKNITESNIINNKFNITCNFENHNSFSKNNFNKKNDTDIFIPKTKRNKACNNSNDFTDIKESNILSVECPEELHFFYIKLLQKGNNLNFEKENKIY